MIKNIRKTTTIDEITRIELNGEELLELICHVFDLDPERTVATVNNGGDGIDLDRDTDVEVTETTSRSEDAAPSKTDLKVPPVLVTKPSIASPPRGAPPPIPTTYDDRECSHDDPEAQ